MKLHEALHVFLPLIDLPNVITAFPVARALSDMNGTPLHIFPGGQHPLNPAQVAALLPIDLAEQGRVLIEQVENDLVDTIINKAGDWAKVVIVLATSLPGDTPKNATEAIAWQLLQKFDKAILIVPPDKNLKNWQLRKLLLPQDGTPGNADTLADVLNQSLQKGIDSIVLRVAGANVGQPKERGSLAMPRYIDQPQYEWETWGQEFLDRVAGLGGQLDKAHLRLMVATGKPAAEIVRVAIEEAVDMIILPWHGVVESGRACTVKAVLKDIPCPVLLLSPRKEST